MKKSIAILLLILLLLCSVCFGQRNQSPLFKYHLKISESNMRLVDVRASMKLEAPYLQMNPWGIPDKIVRGWAQFVEIKSITDQRGKSIAYFWSDSSKRWHLDIDKGSDIRIRYQVKLTHDEHNWDLAGGIDGRPTVFQNQSIFWVTKGLFIYPVGKYRKKSEIHFDVPDDWRVSTAWVKLAKRKFLANDLDMLSSNLLMLGKHRERVITYDNMSITIALAPNFEHRANLIENTLKKILPIYRDVFGELPTANYLVCASKNDIADGEAYNNSFHQMFDDKDLEYKKLVWANTLAHEMFHYWNGTYFLFSEDYASNYWFSEGFTEYYSALSLVKAGIVTQEEYLAKQSFQFSRFHNSQKFGVGKQPSLVQAGKEKFKNWQLIYGGGASIAFMLDVEIRSITKGKKSLDDFMRVLYVKYGKAQKPMTLENQIQELTILTKTDFRPFFDSYVTGTQTYIDPLLSAFEKSGLVAAQYQGEFYLKPRPGLRNSIFKSIIEKRK